MASKTSNFLKRLSRLVIALNLTIALVYLIAELHALRNDLLIGADFSVFYSEGLMILDGYPGSIYDVEMESAYQLRVLEGNFFLGGILPFVYPPHVALLFVPFALFSRPVAVGLWMLCQLGVLTFFLSRLKYLVPGWSRTEYWLAGSAILAYLPMFFTFTIGAFSLIMLTCMLHIYGTLKNRQEGQAGGWFALGLIKPQLLILPGVTLLATRRWKSLLVTFVSGVGIVIISSLILGWQIWPTYLNLLRTLTGYFGDFGFIPDEMYNFRSLLTHILGYEQETLINTFSMLGLAGSVLATFWLWRGPFQPEAPDFSLRMGITLLIGILFNLHAYQQEGLQLIGPALLFYDYLRRRGLPTRLFSILALIFPYVFLLLWFLIVRSTFSLLPILISFGLLTWMGACLARDRKLGDRTAPASG